jgi:Uma2 family endonuclease
MSNVSMPSERFTISQFMTLYEQQPFEIIDGQRVDLPPTVFGHSNIAVNLLLALNLHTLPAKLGKAFMETTIIATDPDNPEIVRGSRVPDVMYISTERLHRYKAAHRDWETKPLVLVPDLAVEIVWPNARYSDIIKRVNDYLEEGVKLVWVVDAEEMTVTVCVALSGSRQVLHRNALLTGGKVIEGFEMPIAAIFE